MNAARPLQPPVNNDGSLYVAHQKVYPREVEGRFNRLRVAATVALLGLFYALPWLQWEGRQAVLFDLPARKFYIFGLTFFPQDFFLLSWLLIIAALSLFFFTALAGRLWCGYACPQTVWTEIFVWMERWTEGNRQQRMRLDQAGWSLNKVARKTGKQLLWISFALYTGYTFVGYFTPVRVLTDWVLTATLGGWELFWIVFYGFATYGNAGYMREQVCKYMCPYARFQGAMFDRNTLVISYDAKRGDPRGSRARGIEPKSKGLGDCIDCTLCVQACPTGIDIRQGLQMECIACAACIDACDSVMDKMNYPRGLVRYTTQNALDNKPTRVVRPRTLIYGSVLLALIVGFAVAVANRHLVEVDVLRDRNALYRPIEGGLIENVYTIRFINKDTREHALRVTARGIDGISVDIDRELQRVGAGEVVSTAVRIRAPSSAISGGRDIQIVARSDDGAIEARSKARFIAPAAR
ncbi:cytochrome c oxidase accessory protein CcoG [Peristeroidobacter agariperforans]|uniref:cytochrome c oxidase accessory protein CcoG n=1 Tax=Peristeroidobacter agariperforans TaxID=268404 RepID=UPI00101B648B|nr:cytochrome c oxidase accessory protein CcoG [Peristeroidobacter agariperforans]